MKREPDFTVGAYLRRWWLIPRNRFFNVYYHEFGLSDQDDLHDHPWVNVSIVLGGSYREHFADGTSKVRSAGSIVFRGAHTLHRLELLTPTVRTLFLTGPNYRRWGFLSDIGWMHWREYLDSPVRKFRPGEQREEVTHVDQP